MKKQIILGLCVWDAFKPTTTFNIIELSVSGLVHGVVCTIGSLLPITRNKLVLEVYKRYPDFTHVLMIDGDMGNITQPMVEALIEADRDIIGPVATFRGPPFQPVVEPTDFNKILDEFSKEEVTDRQIIEVDRIGTGCILVKREVIDSIAEKCETGGYLWFNLDRPPRKSFFNELAEQEDKLIKKLNSPHPIDPEQEVLEAFRLGARLGVHCRNGSEFVGEDYNLCVKAKQNGFKIFMHTQWVIDHIGDCAYNIGDWLTYLQAVQNKDTNLESRLMQATLVWNK